MSRSPRARRRGYTLVELMMALALFTIGVVGVIAMQHLVVLANAHAKNASLGERIAQAWAAQLELDANQWTSGLSSTHWLGKVDDGWVRPDYVAGDQNFGAAFDALGNPLSDSAPDLARARYCTNVRLSWLYPDTTPVLNNGMMRAEIRVYWLRDGQSNINPTSICAAGVSMSDVDKAVDRYHFVYLTVGVRQHFSI